MSELEKLLIPMAVPLLQQLWAKNLLPAVQAADAKIASPELKILGDAGVAALDAVVQGELAALLKAAQA